jgi:hypothetical protein
VIGFLLKCLPLVAPAIRYSDNPNRSYWHVHLLVYAIIIWLLDMVLAHLFFSPKKGEWTISHTLERTAPHSLKHWQLGEAINKISSGHIKALI